VIRRITLENFMSHAHTVIDLADGLTVLVGPNNCGKSAVIEALRTVCENDNGEHLIKHGEGSCRITIETDDGHAVAWCRKGSRVWYEFDSEEQDRLRGQVPPRVHELLRLPPVQTPDDEPVNVHIGLQKNPIFLLADAAAERKAAAFFSSTSDAQHLLQMQQLHRTKRTAAKSRQKELARELEEKERLLEALLPLETLEPRIASLEDEFSAIQKAATQIAQLQRLIDQVDAARERRALEMQRVTQVRELQSPPQQANDAALAKLLDRIEIQSQNASRAQSIRYLLAELKEVPPQSDVQKLCELEKKLKTAVTASESAQLVHDAVQTLQSPPQLQDISPLESFLNRWTQLQQRASNFDVDVVHLNGAIDDVKKDAQAYAEQNPSCPLCGGVIDSSALLSEEHAHA
jgi:exonuclease SbcC